MRRNDRLAEEEDDEKALYFMNDIMKQAGTDIVSLTRQTIMKMQHIKMQK